MIWQTLLLALVSFVITALLAPKPEVENARAQQLKDVSFPRASEDAPIPLILGRVRMDAPNTTWWGDFRSVPIKKKIKTSPFTSVKVIVGYRYFVGLDLALGMGPCSLHQIFMDDKELWAGTAGSTTPTALSINQPSFFGGLEKGGGWISSGTYYPGTFPQAMDAYVASQLGADLTPGYNGTAHVVFNAEIGESAQLRRVAFVLSSYTNALALPNSGRIGDDMNVAEALYQVMTDPWRGMGIDPSELDIPSLVAMGNVLYTEGNGCSVVVTSEADGARVVNELLRQADAIAYQDPETGKVRFKPIRSDYTVGSLPVYDEGDVIKVRSFSRTSWEEVYAQVKVSFPQREKESTAVAVQQDMAVAAQLNGRLRSTSLSFPFVYDRQLASNLAARELGQLSVPLFRITLEMNRNAYTLRPGDVFVLQWPDYQISQMVLRVSKFDLGALLEGKLVVDCIEDRFAVGTAVFAAPDGTGWTNVQVLPTTVTTSRIVEMPRFFAKSLEIPDGRVGVIAFAAKPAIASTAYTMNADTTSGSLDVFEPEDVEYTGTGLLNVAYDRLAGYTDGYDTATGIDLAGVVGTVETGTMPAADIRTGNAGLVLVGTEWMAYETATVAGSLLQLRNVRRGLFGTQIQTHAGATRAWLFETSKLSSGVDDLLESGTLYYKFLDTAGQRTQAPSEVTQSSQVMADFVANRPLRPSRPTVAGSRAPNITATAVQALAALPRSREATQVTFENDAAETPDQAEVYDVTTLVNGVVNPTLSATGVTLPYNLRFDLTAITSSDVETRVTSKRSAGDTRSSAAFAFVRYTVNQ